MSYDKNKPFLLFFGGSLGSKNINKLVENSVDKILEKYNIIHITGKNNTNNINKKGYNKLEFVDNIEDYFDLSDIVVCRGGANSIFEVLALCKPMLIIPLSKAQSRGDQIENAEYFKRKKYASVLREENMTCETLLSKLDYIVKNKLQIVQNMKNANVKNANLKIVDIILKNMSAEENII